MTAEQSLPPHRTPRRHGSRHDPQASAADPRPEGRRAPRPETDTPWTVIVPVKAIFRAKNRLDLPPTARQALARAFALDTIAAVLGAVGPHRTVVVAGDAETLHVVRPLGCEVLLEEQTSWGGDPLNAAVAQGRAWAERRAPHLPCAVVPADLPCLTPETLVALLGAAAEQERTFCPDLTGGGTTVITARRPRLMTTAYGPDSAERHLALGMASMADAAHLRLRLDVDTLDDLRRATELGLGPRTASTARRIGGAGAHGATGTEPHLPSGGSRSAAVR